MPPKAPPPVNSKLTRPINNGFSVTAQRIAPTPIKKTTPIVTAPIISTPIISTPIISTPIISTPIKSTSTSTLVDSGPIIIQTPNLPNMKSVSQPNQILPTSIPFSNAPIKSTSSLPNITPLKEDKEDNTMTYVLIGALIVGFIILQNKDI